MQQFSQGRWRRRSIGLMLIPMTAMALAGIAAAPALARGGGTMTVAKTERSASLGKTVLATNKGRTLYSLSVETGGKFICTRTCLSVWHPLTVAAGVTPMGPVALGTIKRPEGSTQVTFHGHPLYSFDGDSSAGQANGQGIKDVGTWHAAVVPK